MGDPGREELSQLELEFRWLLKAQVHTELKQLQSIISECCRRFQLPQKGEDSLVKPEKFIMSTSSQSTPEQIKCIVTLSGDSVTLADISLKIHKHTNQVYRTTIQSDNPWKLQQIQDAANHLHSALLRVISVEKGGEFTSAEQVVMLLREVMGFLQRGLNCLVVPKKRTIEELQNSRNVKNLQPSLPQDVAVSFYVQAHKLMFAVYHMQHHHGTTKFDVFQAECSVPWLNEAIVLFSMALQQCQQLQDKVDVFKQYKDLDVE